MIRSTPITPELRLVPRSPGLVPVGRARPLPSLGHAFGQQPVPRYPMLVPLQREFHREPFGAPTVPQVPAQPPTQKQAPPTHVDNRGWRVFDTEDARLEFLSSYINMRYTEQKPGVILVVPQAQTTPTVGQWIQEQLGSNRVVLWIEGDLFFSASKTDPEIAKASVNGVVVAEPGQEIDGSRSYEQGSFVISTIAGIAAGLGVGYAMKKGVKTRTTTSVVGGAVAGLVVWTMVMRYYLVPDFG